jgi:hypothetical protein
MKLAEGLVAAPDRSIRSNILETLVQRSMLEPVGYTAELADCNVEAVDCNVAQEHYTVKPACSTKAECYNA